MAGEKHEDEGADWSDWKSHDNKDGGVVNGPAGAERLKAERAARDRAEREAKAAAARDKVAVEATAEKAAKELEQAEAERAAAAAGGLSATELVARAMLTRMAAEREAKAASERELAAREAAELEERAEAARAADLRTGRKPECAVGGAGVDNVDLAPALQSGAMTIRPGPAARQQSKARPLASVHWPSPTRAKEFTAHSAQAAADLISSSSSSSDILLENVSSTSVQSSGSAMPSALMSTMSSVKAVLTSQVQPIVANEDAVLASVTTFPASVRVSSTAALSSVTARLPPGWTYVNGHLKYVGK